MKDIDYELVKELSLTADNEADLYAKEGWLAKNYSKKHNKGKFNFGKAKKGVMSLTVTPFVRSYQNQYGIKIGKKERQALTENRFRNIMRRVRESEF
jgi:hypothetical protein